MAKQAAAPKAPPPSTGAQAAARVTGPASPGELPAQRSVHSSVASNEPTKAIDLGGGGTKVVKWGNGGRVGSDPGEDDVPPSAALTDQTGGTEGAGGAPVPKVAKDRDEPLKLDEEGETPPAPEPAKPAVEPPAPAARRGAALANLEAERKARELEQTVQKLQKQLEAVEPVAKSIKEGTLVQRVKALGLSKQEQAELLEKLLVKDPELEDGAPGGPPAKKSAEVVALEAKLAALEARLNSRDGNDADAQIARAEANIAEDVKDIDLPLIQSEVPIPITEDGQQKVVTPYNLVLRTAYQMWLDSGKNGSSRDYVKKAAANVEAHLREKNPKLAARLDAKKAEGEAEPAPAPAASGPSLGKRAPAGAPSKPSKLSRDRDVRDQEIKREMGW